VTACQWKKHCGDKNTHLFNELRTHFMVKGRFLLKYFLKKENSPDIIPYLYQFSRTNPEKNITNIAVEKMCNDCV
jgi:hypothetical protein